MEILQRLHGEVTFKRKISALMVLLVFITVKYILNMIYIQIELLLLFQKMLRINPKRQYLTTL